MEGQKQIVVFFNEETGQYFFSRWHYQSAPPGFVQTSFSVPHEHTHFGTVNTGQDIIKYYYSRATTEIQNPEPEYVPV